MDQYIFVNANVLILLTTFSSIIFLQTIEEDSTKSLDFWGAREECKKIGGDLPIQLEQSSNKYLYSLAKEFESDLWIGITENVS